MRLSVIFLILFLLFVQLSFAKDTADQVKATPKSSLKKSPESKGTSTLANSPESVSTKSLVLQKTLDKYANAKSLQAEMTKTDEKVILGTKTESTGSMLLEKNKIFISQSGEKKVEFFFINNVLTLVEYPDADFGKDAGRKVTTLKKSVPSFVKSLLNLFSNPKSFNSEFKTIGETKTEKEIIVDLKPAAKNLNKFSLKIDAKSNEITELNFVDDVDTKTTIKFNNIQLNKKFAKGVFQFTKLKTDEEIAE